MRWPWHRNGEAREAARRQDEQLRAARELARQVDRTARDVHDAVDFADRVRRALIRGRPA